ncbi:MAG: FtsW/RodA/SpoVE family cell cycle protein [Anaerolineae bacterium]|nr:FtsW/RodA/SpoVE family cell cycle protein [Anaerolineae bacterium]
MVAAIRVHDASGVAQYTDVLRYVALEALVVAALAAAQRGISLCQSLLRAQLGQRVNVMILEKALTLELRHFEDSEFYDKLTRARREASSRPLSLVMRTFGLVQNGVSLISYAVLLVKFSPWAVLVLLLAGVAGYFASARVAQRINIWLNPWADPQNTSFQIVQSLIAIANGGLFGRGLGQGRPDFVPAVHTDFPFAAISEELGLVGAIIVIALFAVLVLRGWRIAQHSQSAYAQLLAGGLAVSMALQVFVILGGNLGLVPLTGVTLPFISYGGSSLLVQFVSMGLVVRIEASQGDVSPYPARPTPSPTLRAAIRLKWLCAALFAVLALSASYWGVVQSDALVNRNDNPRQIIQPR